MSIGSFLLQFLFLFSANSAPPSGPTLFQMQQGNIMLSKSLQQLVKIQHRDFELVQTSQFSKNARKNSKGHPMAVTGDFNGDGVKDLAFSGYSRREKKFFYYAALSIKKDNKYTLKIIDQHSIDKKQEFKNLDTYLTLGNAKKIKAKRDTVQIEHDSTKLMTVEPFYYSIKSNSFKIFKGQMD